jgi:Fic family protein
MDQNIKPSRDKALMLAQRALGELVYDAVQLEGINFTLPEVLTLLDGVTVGGHKLSDQQITVNQGNAWRQLFDWIKREQFEVSAEVACRLHAIAAKEEALTWGEFRSGGVFISGTDYIPPPADQLPELFDAMVSDMRQHDDIYDRAIQVFLAMARCQFFYDVNKRMGRMMMNGVLLSSGYPAINLPAKRRQEFNQLMLAFYDSDDQGPMNRFMRSCLDPRAVAIMAE